MTRSKGIPPLIVFSYKEVRQRASSLAVTHFIGKIRLIPTRASMKVFVLAGLVACAYAGVHPGGPHAALLFKVFKSFGRFLKNIQHLSN